MAAAPAAGGIGNLAAPAPLPPAADALALELIPSLNDSALAHEIATGLGVVGNMTTVAQSPSRSGTPGWTTGLLAALISVAVLISLATVVVLVHRNLRRQRREVLESFLSFQEAEAAAVEAANSARQRFLLARASRSAAQSPRQPREPPVVVVQPDLSPSLCIKEVPSRAFGGSGWDREGATPSAPAALAGSSLTGSQPSSSSSGGAGAGVSGEQRQPEGGPPAGASAAAGPEDADLEAGPATAAGSERAAAASAAPSAPVRRLALDFPGLGATMLLLLPSGPHSGGVLLWNDGSGASVLPGASWWGAQPPHEPPPVFQSTIELAAQPQEQQQEQQQQQQEGEEEEERAEGPQQRLPPGR